MKSEQQYIDLYGEAADIIKSKSCPVMNALRDTAFETFRSQGFPTRKVERYRYTDVEAAFAPNYGVSLSPLTIKPSPYIFNLKDAPEDIAALYGSVADSKDPITALNTALVHETLLVHVPRNTKVDAPITIDYWLRGEAATMMNRRILILMETGAEATIIINDHAADKQRFLSTQVIEVICRDNAHLDMYEIEETTPLCSRFSNVYIREGRDCSVKHNSITLFNGQTRNLCDVYLQGENSEVTLNGCAIASANQRIDNNTLIDHKVGHCTSNELYKYVLDENAVGAFAGKVLVRHGAQHTTSQETNQNLCTTKTARMFTQPMLEIYADDVKCAHGSTVGQLNDAALFYMQQRGISKKEAKLLLEFAFINEVIDHMKLEPLRDRLHYLVEKRFRGELNKCEGCKLCK